MKNEKISAKIISLFLTFIILFSASATPVSLAIEEMLNSTYYEIDNEKNIIGRIEPETPVDVFLTKMNVDDTELKVYQDSTCAVEVTTGFVGTGMVLKYDDKLYELSVVGDFDKDGKATQVELTNIIRHIVGLTGAELTGIYYESADLTGDNLVDQRDITKYIRYIVFGELDLGKVDTTPPILTVTVEDIQANSAKVIATAIDKEAGMGDNPTYTFYLKVAGQPDTSYIEAQKGTNNELNLSSLLSNTEYEVKVVTHDKAGNKAEKTITLKTTNIEGTLTFSNVTWSEGQASVDITSTSPYTIEYQINSVAGTWIQGTTGKVTINNLNHNDIVYARLTDGSTTTPEQTKQIKDEKEPEIALNIIKGISELNITANATDSETGIATDAEYVFYLDGVEKQRTTSNTCTITGLKANTDYTVKVEIEDKAGNIGTKEETVTTESLPNINNAGALEFSSVTWEGGFAKVTITTNTIFQIEYQVNGIVDGSWTTVPKGTTSVTVQNLNHNDIVYARLTDAINVSDTKNIKIEDKIAPNVTLSLNKTTSTITATASAIDKETGIDSSAEYIFYVKENGGTYTEKQRSTSNTCTITSLKADTDYTIKVEIADKAGNVGSKEQGTSTENVPSASTPGNIMFSAATWTSGTASVTISTTTSYTIEYQVNGVTEGAWTAGTTVSGLNHNDVIYARLTDGTNAGSYISQTIVDAIAPNITLNLETDTQKITATATAIDNESRIPTDVTYKFSIKDTGADDSTYVEKQNTTSNICEFTGLVEGKDYTIKVEVQDVAGNLGIKEESKEIPDDIAPVVNLTVTGKTSNSITAEAEATDVGGMPATPTYVFYIKKTGEADTSYRQVQSSSSATCTFTGLATNTDYTIKVTVKDDAGNEGMKEVSSLTDRIPDGTDAGAITFSSITWTSGKATVTIKTNTSYTIEYQVNGIADGSWVEGTTVNNLKHGDVIYARLTDGVSSSSPATLNVVDDKKPQVTLSLTGAISEITATANATDLESGIPTTATYKFSIKKASEPDTSYVVKQNTTSNVCNITGLLQGTNYVVKVEVQDAAGNVNYTTQSIKTNTMPAGTTAGAITFSSPVWETGKAKVEISTTTSYYIEYQVNRTSGTWTKATVAVTNITVTGLNHNDIVYARLTDGINVGDYASITIADTIKPENFTISVPEEEITYEALKITSTGTIDNQTGLKDYSFVVTEDGSIVKEITNQTVTEHTIEDLEAETEYVVYMLAYDNAGNVRKSNEVTVTTPKMPIGKLFGQYVNYEIDLDDDGDTTNDWMIFYKEDDETSPNYGATYLIADYYVPASKMTTSLTNAGMSLYSGTYRVRWSSVPTYKTITDDVKSIFMYDFTGTSDNSVKAVSRLLDITAWKDDFVTSQLQAKGGMAIGGATLNMWCASWNKVYPTELLIPSMNSVGYLINGGIRDNLASYKGYNIDAPNVYFPTKKLDSDETSGYWISSSSGNYNEFLFNISRIGELTVKKYNTNYLGLRPVIYLPPSVTLTPDATTANLWNINY